MTNLKSVNVGHNKYGGPAVLSILTGRSTDECAYAIGRVNGEYNATGVQLSHLIKAAENLGFVCIPKIPYGSLFRTLTAYVSQDGIYIVSIPKHFVCIEIKEKKIYFCDNHTKEPMPAASSARLMQQVEFLHKVERKPKPEVIEPRYITVVQIECVYCRARASTEQEVIHYSTCVYDSNRREIEDYK